MKKSKGFTLIELLTVMGCFSAIMIMIIVAIALIVFIIGGV